MSEITVPAYTWLTFLDGLDDPQGLVRRAYAHGFEQRADYETVLWFMTLIAFSEISGIEFEMTGLQLKGDDAIVTFPNDEAAVLFKLRWSDALGEAQLGP